VISKKIFAFLLLLNFSAFTQAGPFTDRLSVCLVQNTSTPEKQVLLTWVYAAMSAHPKVYEMSNVTLEQGDEISKQMAEIFNELITVRCKDETIEAFRYEGQATFEESFQVLGEVAMTELMTNNKVNSYMEGFTKYLDTEALENLFD
jgi:hypothetical protein